MSNTAFDCGFQAALEDIPAVIEALTNNGYQVLSPDELFALHGAPTTPEEAAREEAKLDRRFTDAL